MSRVPEAWLAALRSAERIALFSHVHPDGDTVGATLALRLALLSIGKQVTLVCDGDVPESMRFLPGAEAYIRPEALDVSSVDTALSVDVSSPDMLGAAQAVYERVARRLVIDHHATNPAFGQENFIRGGESSCCLLAYEAILALGVVIDQNMATCLLLGMSTDTGHFRYTSTSAETLEAAGALVRAGADIADISRRMYRTQPMRKVLLMRRALNAMHFALSNQVGIIWLRRSDFEATGCSFGEADGLVNLALEIEGVRMAFMLSERDEGIKVSLRAMEPDTVNDIALALGGGGHAQAAGCTLKMTIEEAEALLLERMRTKLEA